MIREELWISLVRFKCKWDNGWKILGEKTNVNCYISSTFYPSIHPLSSSCSWTSLRSASFAWELLLLQRVEQLWRILGLRSVFRVWSCRLMELSYAPRMGRIHSLLFCTSNNALLATTAASKPSWRPLKSLWFRSQGLAPGLSFSTGIRFSELQQCGISPLHGLRLPINGRKLKCSLSFREPSEEQNSLLCSSYFLRNASSSRIFAGNSGAFVGGGVSANSDRECEIHDNKNQPEDVKGKHRGSKQTGDLDAGILVIFFLIILWMKFRLPC